MARLICGPFLALFAMTASTSISLNAGEFGGGAVDADAEAVVVYAADPGVSAVYDAQAAKHEVIYSENAEESLREYMDGKKFQMGWDPGSGRFFALQRGQFGATNPAEDLLFLNKRDVAAKEAVLRAKADIIYFIKTEMSAYDRIRTPGTIANEELGPEYEALARRMAGLCGQVSMLAGQFYGAAEAAALGNAHEGVQLREIQLHLERMGGDLARGRIPAERRGEIERCQALCKDMAAARDALEERAKSIKESNIDARSETRIERFSEMALTGATVIQQAESWDGRQYEVAVLMCWSHNLEKMARATLAGLPVEIRGKTGTHSRNEWMAARDLSAMTGAYQFLDDQGRRNFIGVAAQPVGRNSGEERANRTAADMLAGQMAAFSLYADVAAYSLFQRTHADLKGGAGETMSDAQESISQAVNRREIRGMQPIRRAKARHPELGVEMQVSVYCISAEDAAAAMKAEEANIKAAIAVKKHQSMLRGRAVEFQRQLQDAENDRGAYIDGMLGARSALQQPPQAAAQVPNAANPGRPPAGSETPRPFIRMSGNVDDDF